MPQLTLYFFEECPYCQKVLSYLESMHIEVALKNTRKDKAAREELIRVGGKAQVPCLFIDGQPLYESSDILAWLQQNGEKA